MALQMKLDNNEDDDSSSMEVTLRLSQSMLYVKTASIENQDWSWS